MKKIFLSALVIALQLTTNFAQTRQAITYQAIARNKNQVPIGNANVQADVKIFRNGNEIYSEKVNKTTAPTGLFTLEIGRGNAADFQKIDWSSGDFELEVAVSGAVNISPSRSPILSVPFAFRAANLESNGATGGQVLKWDATAQKWLPAKDEIGNGGDVNLEDLKDVDLAGLQTGQVLKWDGSKWTPQNDSIGDGWGSVVVQTIDDKITGDGTAGNRLTISANAIGSAEIADNSIEINDLNFSVPQTLVELSDVQTSNLADGQVLKWDSTAKKWTAQNDIGGGMGDGWGSVVVQTIDDKITGDGTAGNRLTIAANAIGSAEIEDGSIGSAEIADGSIGSVEIADGSIGSTEIADGSIGSTKIADGSIGSAEIADNSIEINDLNFSVPQTLDQLTDVEAAAPTPGQVLKWSGSQWQPAADDQGTVGDGWGSVVVQTDNKIAGDGTAGNPLTIAANAIGSTEIANGSITAADLAAGVSLPPSGAAGNDLSGTYPNPTVARLRGKNISPNLPQQGDILMFDGGEWKPFSRTIRVIEEQTTGGSDAGAALLNFTTRKLNDISPDNNSPFIQLNASNSTITLLSGTYFIQASAPAYKVAHHKILFREHDTGSAVLVGTDEYTSNDDPSNEQTRSFIYGFLVIPAGSFKTYRLDHWVASPDPAINGLGLAHGPATGTQNIFARVIIEKIQ